KMDLISKKERTLESSQTKLADRTTEMDRKNKQLQQVLNEETERLQTITQLSKSEATELLLKRLEQQLKKETGDQIVLYEKQLRENREQKAREIIGIAVARYAAEHTSQTTVSSVDLPNDDMKGRIIGREGRNIRAFEKATGVDVIVDETPGIVIVSGFDPVRRETAKLALQKLIQDGRIHPSRIEEIVTETKKEIEKHIEKEGTIAAREADVIGLHIKIVNLLGRLKFRTSYSQNVLRHSIEVAHLTGLLAEQLHLDPTLARRCGLLHDIGKAADHELEGGHPQVGADLLKRHGEESEVVEAARGHHDDLKPENIYTVLVAAADAISASRPGARRETLEKYVKRLEELEGIASSFDGVEQAYAVQAGREVRVMVNAETISDSESASVCRNIAKSIEEQLTYPGEIKVTLVREVRIVETAK
ncbi:MAG: ribonuclease Y, partial [Planctomycetota bacterium]|nr:ribonuclease Y [Planctomycetota bacterium]